MKLYYAPGGCSLSPHIALREAGIAVELHKVDFTRGKLLADGSSLADVSAKGYIPALVLDDGQLLTEGAVMVQYIADLAPDSKLAPPAGSFERYRLQEWLNFIGTELHKGFAPLYSPSASAEFKASVKDRLALRMDVLARGLDGKSWLMGERFTVADGYAYYALRMWKRMVRPELPGILGEYFARIEARPAVQEVLAAEGLS
jgi:glutathione S-transferase